MQLIRQQRSHLHGAKTFIANIGRGLLIFGLGWSIQSQADGLTESMRSSTVPVICITSPENIGAGSTHSPTPLAGLRHKDKWLNYEQAMVQGLSIRKAATRCGIAKNTSFKWRHRFLRAPVMQQPTQMSGIAEADETFFLESFKGQRHLPRIARKRGGKAAKKGTSAEQIPVLG
jgi:hypothetical protein